MLKLYNTLSRRKEVFKPIVDAKNSQANFGATKSKTAPTRRKQQDFVGAKVGIYVCGPTVYFFAHIGNHRAYVFADTLRRVLKLNNYKVKHVMNITDVGHLTSDQDEGEDKIEKEARKQRKTPRQIASFYEKDFFKDFDRLNNERPEVTPRATEHIKEMIEIIKKLEKRGYAYVGENGNVYFDTSKFEDYEKLAKLNLEELQAGTRLEIDKNKKQARDFVLWFSEKGSKFKGHVLKWKSPWGVGWPGWHIECSAMSMKYLGKTIDIHTGGEDHIPVHHTNEIAQSEGATGKKFVNYWMHVAFLQFNAEKMSKSRGGILRLQNLVDKRYSPMDLRYFYLSGHYRKPLNFTFVNLNNSRNSLKRLREIISKLEKEKKVNSKNINMAYQQFMNFIDDDLNTSRGLSFMWEILREDRLNDSEKYELVLKFDKVFGLKLGEEEKVKVQSKIRKLIREREKARRQKDFVTADKIRDKIEKAGYIIEDKEKGVVVKKR